MAMMKRNSGMAKAGLILGILGGVLSVGFWLSAGIVGRILGRTAVQKAQEIQNQADQMRKQAEDLQKQAQQQQKQLQDAEKHLPTVPPGMVLPYRDGLFLVLPS